MAPGSSSGTSTRALMRVEAVHRWVKEHHLGRSGDGAATRPAGVCLCSDEAMALHAGPAGHPEAPARIKEILKQLELAGLSEACEVAPSREATEEELLRCHSEIHVERVVNFEASSRKKKGAAKAYSCPFGPDTYVCEHTPHAARLAAGCLLSLVDKCLEKGAPAKVGMAVVRPPGHHATEDRASGFCLFNNVAVAARHLQSKHGLKRIAIIDWDVHHGNGTSDLFVEDPDVLFFSMHRWDNHGFFPGTGFLEDAGKTEGKGYTVNVPLDKGYKDHDVAHVMRYILCPLVEKFAPEAILVSAGFDAVKGDPLGDCRVSPEGFGWMTRCLYRLAHAYCKDRLWLVLEGGYSPDLIAQCTVECVQSLVAEASGTPGPWHELRDTEDGMPGLMSPPVSTMTTPASSMPGTPVLGTASPGLLASPEALQLTPEHSPRGLSSSPQPQFTMRITPATDGVGKFGSMPGSPARSVPNSPALSHLRVEGGHKQKAKGPSAKTVKVVRLLSEMHHLLPLELPLAPQQEGKKGNAGGAGCSSKSSRKNDRRRRKMSGMDEEDEGHHSDASSGWAIACAGSDRELEVLLSPYHGPSGAGPGSMPLSRQTSGEPSAFPSLELPESQLDGEDAPGLARQRSESVDSTHTSPEAGPTKSPNIRAAAASAAAKHARKKKGR